MKIDFISIRLFLLNFQLFELNPDNKNGFHVFSTIFFILEMRCVLFSFECNWIVKKFDVYIYI